MLSDKEERVQQPMQLLKKIKYIDEVAYRGKNALRLLMAADTPSIDLLVRESIQNSLDAALNDAAHVAVEFRYGQFDAQNLRGVLDDETVEIVNRIHPGMSTSLYVRDVGTKGLSGPRLHRNLAQGDEEGNYLKLCFSMGAAQDQEDSGGSWGFGKTVFFRACHAPVMFYSRFREESGYTERLLFYLIEDPNLADALTRGQGPPASTGFAWWGSMLDNGSILPCEDGEEIAKILERLGGIPRYIGQETGTLIFMPCLRKDRQMPSNLDPSEPSAGWIPRNSPPTIREFEEYTNVAIQRWYAPRIDNRNFTQGKPHLIARVGDNRVGSDRYPLLPLTKIMRLLYDCGNGCVTHDFMSRRGIEVFDIKLKNTFTDNSSAGIMAVMRIAPEDPILEMGPPNNHWEPLVQAGGYNPHEMTGPPPILAMTRSPGMIVSYENHGNWVDAIKSDPDRNYLIALFILRSGAIMKENFSNHTLEEEIRQNEPPAHNRWESGQGKGGEQLNLVQRIQAGVQRAINGRFYTAKEATAIKRDSGLAAILANRLLPPGFGNESSQPPPAKPKEGTSANPRGKDPRISILKQSFLPDDEIEIEIELYTGEAQGIEVSMNVASEGSHISAKEWGNEIQTRFPFKLIGGKVFEFKRGIGAGRQLSWTKKDLPLTHLNEDACYHIFFTVMSMKSFIRFRLRIQLYSPEAIPVLIAKPTEPMRVEVPAEDDFELLAQTHRGVSD